jgi:hypothetical protein
MGQEETRHQLFLDRNRASCHSIDMRLGFFITIFFVSLQSIAFAADPPCPKDEMRQEWRACQKSPECTSIYHRCKSEAINRKFEKKAKEWLKGCRTCDASAIPLGHAKCKNKKCELDPPYSPLRSE